MISIDVTLVRSTETFEPVAVFDRVDDLIELGLMTDEVTDPSSCQYADVTIECDLSILFHDPAPDWMTDRDQRDKLFSGVSLGSEMTDIIMQAFISSNTKWCDFPVMNYLGSGLSVDKRMSNGDIF